MRNQKKQAQIGVVKAEEGDGEGGGAGRYPEGPSQQCQDDAGPPWGDDGDVPYYSGFPNAPVLPDSGECADPLKAACAKKGALSAYLDGPVNCGKAGWFCRISYRADHRQPGFREGQFPDSNYASCNQSDTEHDRDGHCHGSDVDDTYGWWIRDHWHRNYAGDLKCCCNWQATIGVVNRCDYRKHVTAEVLKTCRDANEEHNVDWSPGCTPEQFTNYQEPADAQCWSLKYFGPGSRKRDPSLTSSPTPNVTPAPPTPAEPTEEPTADPTEEDTEEPTEGPTEEATAQPTENSPSKGPTKEPSNDPTSKPTETPTDDSPTMAPEPTPSPSKRKGGKGKGRGKKGEGDGEGDPDGEGDGEGDLEE
jgi:hypothetical protein